MAASVILVLWCCVVMRFRGAHWLDYDPVALTALVVGIGIVMLVALSI